jgi:formimidoylglutamate deiminase
MMSEVIALRSVFARNALLPDGWRQDVRLTWDEAGDLTEVAAGASLLPGEVAQEYILPGMINLHSHSFQRALGGLTEKAGPGQDSFWTWRDLMYRFAANITPEHMEAIAAQLFSECLRYGFTAVCEFHYVHRDKDGAFYANPAETAQRVAAAARHAGIGLTMLPVLYSYANFGEAPLKPEQKRFRTDAQQILMLIDALEGGGAGRDGQFEVGVAPHSLRAASIEQIEEVLAVLPAERPVHVHIAEQRKEVDDCVTWSGRRPVELLNDRIALDARWCLIHATHLTTHEVNLIAASGAVAGLCPSTEANLGDGLFRLGEFLAAGGRFGIGTDSHISHSAVEELRWLEYGQRLASQRRNIAVSDSQRKVGDFLWQQALAGGAQASGRRVGALAVGKRADLIVLDSTHPNLYELALDDVLGSFIFCGNDNLVNDVLVGGQWVVRDQRHIGQEAIGRRFCQALSELRRAG